MKNGCKPFHSDIMDKIKIAPHFENRLNDLMFAQEKLRVLNNRGHNIEDTIQLTEELYHYIIYLYQHIKQLEQDKLYLQKKCLTKHHNL